MESSLTLFYAPFSKEIPFVLWGGTVQTPPKTQPLQFPFPLLFIRKSASEVPGREIFAEENCMWRGGVEREKKGEKNAQKKRWVLLGQSNLRGLNTKISEMEHGPGKIRVFQG